MPLMDEVAEHDLNNDQQQYEQQKQEEESARRQQIAENFTVQRRRAVGNLLQLANDIAGRIDDPVEATQVTAEFYERVADMFADGQQLADNFISQSGANQAQVNELESRAHELEQELRDAQGNRDDLERSAQRASDLQIQVNELEREQRRLQQEVSTLTDENARLRSELDTANSDKDAAVESSDAWQSQVESLQQQLSGANSRIATLQQEKNDAVDDATHWHTIALAHGYEEHPSSDQPDATDEPAQGDEPLTRLIDPENGTFRGDQPEAPASGESPQPRRRLTRPARRSRRSGSGNIPEQHRPDEGA